MAEIREGAYVNSEGEKVSIETCTAPEFEGQKIIVIHDDPPPRGSGRTAPMLLDEGTAAWLRRQLGASEPSVGWGIPLSPQPFDVVKDSDG